MISRTLIWITTTSWLLMMTSLLAEGSGSKIDGWTHEEMKRFPAAEAIQGVAVDGEFFYAIDNYKIGKYRKDTGERAGGWEGEKGGPIKHLNSGVVMQGKLYVAHSNYPQTPATNSVEIWDTATMKHEGAIPLGTQTGSLTWACQRENMWFVCYARYAKDGGVGPAGTRLVRYDPGWQETGAWRFPAEAIAKFGNNSASGGAFGPCGRLYVTGHDAKELYVLGVPKDGDTLRWIGVIPIAAEGQAFAWDHGRFGVFYSIARSKREVIVSKISPP